MSFEVRKLAGVAELRVFAHPLRQALYEQVILFGPLTATELAKRVGESPSNCSWHLRVLAEHGFVEEASGATGRNRPWQAAAVGLDWSDTTDDEAGRAGEAATRMLLDRELLRRDAAVERLRRDDQQWRDAAGTHQSLLWLTAEELAEIHREFRALIARYGITERHEDPEQRPEGARLCALVEWGVPAYDLEHEPGRETSAAPQNPPGRPGRGGDDPERN